MTGDKIILRFEKQVPFVLCNYSQQASLYIDCKDTTAVAQDLCILSNSI